MSSGQLAALCSALGLGDDADAIIGTLMELYRQVDRELEERAHGLDLPCHRGCDDCCHESVFLSAPEFLAVAAELMVTRAPAERAKLVAQMSALAARFADELEQLEEFPPGPERDEVAARIHFACPLLGPLGACTVYPARELNARTFGASWDRQRNEPYGCHRTVQRLTVLQPGVSLPDPREMRGRLVRALPGTEHVQVYPWWFARYGQWLL